MLIYKNISYTAKTFYGVKFKPGDTKTVPGYINDNKFIRIKSVPKELPERTEVAEPTESKRRGRPKKSQQGSKQAESNLKPKEDNKSSKKD